MTLDQILTTVVSVLSALAPAVLYITGQFKKLNQEVVALKSDVQSTRSDITLQLKSGLDLVNQKIEAIERQISDQQSHLLKIQGDHTSLSERVAVTEANLDHLDGLVKAMASAR